MEGITTAKEVEINCVISHNQQQLKHLFQSITKFWLSLHVDIVVTTQISYSSNKMDRL